MMMKDSDADITPFPAVAPPRRGSTLTGVLAALGIAGAFATIVYVVVPTDIHGSGGEVPQPVAATHENNQELITSLAALIGRSAEVIAVHPRTASPYMEIVLRLHDTDDADDIPANQIAVLSHSTVLHTIMFHAFEGGGNPSEIDGAGRSGDSVTADSPSRSGATVLRGSTSRDIGSTPTYSREELASPAFCDRWRSNPNVKSRLLARGISDMQVQTLNRVGDRSATLRLSLTWSPDSVDGTDTAAVLVNAAMDSRAE